MAARCKSRAELSYAILFAAASLLIAACGSASTRSTTGAAGESASKDSTPRTTAQLHRNLAGRDVVRNGVVTQRPVRGTGGNEINDENPGRADSGNEKATGQTDPCNLVSKADAQAIIGRTIATPQEAPLGPTCIYQPLDAKGSVTVAVESIDFAKLRPQIRKRIQIPIGGRAAYCGDYGRPTTFVPLANGRVLNVTAPCAVGIRFAEKALPRLKD